MKCIGIDLGTTNTVAAIDKKVFDIDQQSGPLLPSVAAFPPTGIRLVGTAARRRRTIDPLNTIFSTKRLIGRKWYSADVKEFQSRYHFDLVEGQDGYPNFKTRSGQFDPVDIATMLLQRVCQFSPFDFGEVAGVVTVPSLFKDAAREATMEAADMAGLTDVKIIDEPTAVALAYLSVREEKIGRAAVYDFGGGTFDLAIVDCSAEKIEVLGHGGDLYLGGDDIDQGLARWAAEEVLEKHRWDLRTDDMVYSRLVAECEQAKIRLSKEEQTRIDLTRVDSVSPAAAIDLRVDREISSKLTSELVYRTFIICDEVLGSAGVKTNELDALFVAGGPTQLPTIRRAIEEYFGKLVDLPYHPMHIVAIGASIAGEYLWG